MKREPIGLHPVFQNILDAFTNPQPLVDAKRTAYIQALRDADWLYEFSEDPQVYARGREQVAQLRLAQKELDPAYVLWNEHCNPLYRVELDLVERFRAAEGM